MAVMVSIAVSWGHNSRRVRNSHEGCTPLGGNYRDGTSVHVAYDVPGYPWHRWVIIRVRVTPGTGGTRL